MSNEKLAVMSTTDEEEYQPPNRENDILHAFIAFGIFGFAASMGPLPLHFAILVSQFVMFQQIIKTGQIPSLEKQLIGFRFLNWLLYFSFDILVFVHELGPLLDENSVLPLPKKYYTMIQLTVLCILLSSFVLLIDSRFIKYQLQQLGWTIATTLVVVIPSAILVRNALHGLIWVLLPSLLIFLNNLSAVVFDRFFGRTPLTKIFPNKTWEGFIGATCITFVFGFLLPVLFVLYPDIACSKATVSRGYFDCSSDTLYTPVAYKIPSQISHSLFNLLPEQDVAVSIIPMQWVGVFLAAFASIVSPFGGILLTVLRRAYSKKEFVHAQIFARLDSQLLIGILVYVYLSTFVAGPEDISQVVDDFMRLSDVSKIEAFRRIQQIMHSSGQI